MRTRLTIVFVVFAAVGLVLATQLGAFQAQETRAIPLNTAYATFDQDGIKPLDGRVDNEALGAMVRAVQDGAQRIVLCDGIDIVAAAKSSALDFSMPEAPVPFVANGRNDAVWVAAFLGSDGSIPPAYVVRSISVTDNIVRVAYVRDDSTGRTCDLSAYLIWAPLGRLEAGMYTLELFDAAAGTVTVTRRWQVK